MLVRKFSIVSLPLLCAAFCISASAQTLLVVNQHDADVSLIDPHTGKQIAAIDEHTPGVHGHEIAVSSDSHTAYLPIYGSTGVGKPGIDGHEMLVIDLPSRTIVRHVDFGHGVRPHQPVLDAQRNLLYVTTELDKSVAVLDAKTLKIVGSVPTGQEESHMLALSSDGRWGYTANVGPGTVSVLDMVRRKMLAVVPVAEKIQRISVSRDNKLVFTSDQTSPRLAVIDAAKKSVQGWIDLPGSGYGTDSTLDGGMLLVAIPSKNQIAVVDLKQRKVTRTIDVPASPQEVLVRPDGRIAYVSCNNTGKVAVIDLTTWKVDSIFAAGRFADGLAWAK
ncbi:MAG: hypothetical protein JSS87_05090 [Acidobacteria bacterium]|nr:hypothetical protein [Acidobacteriota bacterium]